MTTAPRLREALRFWAKLGWISFGGPAGQIAIMHTELVERKRWLSETQFLRALNFCMLLPGPEATQLAIYSGWRLHGVRGGLVAGVLFVAPAAVLLWALSWLYVAHGQVAWVAGVFHGLKPAVTAIVAAAVIRIGRRALRGPLAWGIAAAAFAGLFWLKVPFPLVIAGAALVGFSWPAKGKGEALASANVEDDAKREHRSLRGMLRVAAVGVALWFAPVVAAAAWLGGGHAVVREGLFFSQAALLTFGGAYAVLPYVAQQAVEVQGWLSASQMLDGLGLAETTPGPLIMVLQFVGFVGGWNQPGGLSPLAAGTLGAAMTTWTTFAPSFLFIFLGAPWVERLGRLPRLDGALAAVTAAVVGVILNLAVWFGVQTFRPAGGSVDVFAVVIGVLALAALQWRRVGVAAVVVAGGALGWAWSALVI